MFVTWPVRLLWRLFFGRRALAKSRVKRVVVLGLDGLDHGLTEKLLAEGKLPHLAALRDRGLLQAARHARCRRSRRSPGRRFRPA